MSLSPQSGVAILEASKSPELAHVSFPGREDLPRVEWQFDNRFNLDEPTLEMARYLLDLSRVQQFQSASPLLSNFRVGSSAYCGEEKFAVGSNYERGAGRGLAADDAIHGEDSVIANALTRYGKDTRLHMVAVTTDAPDPASSCGRCRGALESYADGDIIELSGGMNNQVAMWKLSELLPKKFELCEPGVGKTDLSLLRIGDELMALARRASYHSFQPFTKEVLGACGAAILADGKTYSSPRIDVAAFYGTSALAGAIAAARAARPARIEAVALISKEGVPTAEERQFLYEFANLYKCDSSLPVFFHSQNKGESYLATPRDILPFAFGPRDLGLDMTTHL